MKSPLHIFLVAGIALTTMAFGDDTQDDMKAIEGTWVITELVVNGNVVKEEDFKKISVVNGADGTGGYSLKARRSAVAPTSLIPK